MKNTAANLGQRYVLAYLALFALILGDTLFAEGYINANPAWIFWLSISGLCLLGSIYFLLKSDWLRVVKQIPIELILLIALMIGSAPWSAYASDTVTSFGIQIGVTTVALFFITCFSWRQIHGIFANAVRVVIFGSFLIELVASTFKGSLGLLVPASEVALRQALGKSGHLFDGGRIQGLLGNANFTAAWALIGVITFAIEIAIRKDRRKLAIASLLASISMIAIAQSAGVIFASAAVLVSAIVSLVAEGKDRDTRHRYYRVAWALAGAATFLVLVFRRPVFEFLGKSPDMTHRSDIWRKVLSLISQRPLEGWGFTGVWVPGARPLDGLIVINGETYYQAHNAYLDMWLQLGAVGLILFVILLTRTFVKTWQLGVHHSNPLYLWPLLLLVTQLMRGITESRLLIQSAMFMLIVFAVKVYDPENLLEENSDKTKIKQLDKLRKKTS